MSAQQKDGMKADCGVVVQEDGTCRKGKKPKGEVTLLASLVHDMKTPVVTIGGYARRLHSGKIGAITDEQKEALDIIIGSCQRLEHDLKLILEHARHPEAFSETFFLRGFDLKASLKKQVRNFKIQAQEKGISLILDVPSWPVRIKADWRMIDKAVSNLLDNALRYTVPGGRVLVALSEIEHTVEIKISDNGRGLDKEQINLIRRPLGQDVRRTRRRPCGWGLGLHNVKRYVALHHGELKVESKIGRGSSFTIRLPKEQKR